MKRFFYLLFYSLVFLISLISVSSCGYIAPTQPELYLNSYSFSSPPTYEELNTYIFESKCLGCHSSDDVDFSSYDNLMAGSSVVSSDPASSSLYQEVLSGAMPKGSSALSQTEIEAIYEWISNGASE